MRLLNLLNVGLFNLIWKLLVKDSWFLIMRHTGNLNKISYLIHRSFDYGLGSPFRS